ncbi:22315_t:CDS:10 [Dentiscutata erythropus]|uniref:22315_t:CDS:1 n=1 Tax=Dentiscutata erythropus TaxID=1348616 RepID=A0A9N9G7W4_9GLOM|nr:22315_t:CDS:10 [Dentiscutata erythropus]
MYNRYQSNQPTPNTQRNNYPAYGQTFQPPQPQQTPAVLHAGLPTHGATASQFNAFTPLSNYGSRFSADLRAGYGAAHISSHQSQIQQQTQQQHLSWQNKNWSADLSTSGGTNSQASHGGNMMTGNLYGTGGASGSNANSSLYGGDDHTYQSHSTIGGHTPQPSMAASLSAFHTSPTPASQQPHNTAHNNSMLSLPNPNSSSSVTSSLLRQQMYPTMDTMSSITGMGGSLGVSGFPRHDANLSQFTVVDDAQTDIDADALMDNQMVTTTLASNTPNSINSITNSATVSPSVNGSISTPKRQSTDTSNLYGTSSISRNATIYNNSLNSYVMSGQPGQQQQSYTAQQQQQSHTTPQQQQSYTAQQAAQRYNSQDSFISPNVVSGYSSQQTTSSNVQQPQQFQQQHQQQIQQQQLQNHQQTTRSPYQNYNTTSPNIAAQQQQSIHNRSSISQNPTPMKSSPLITKPAIPKSTMISSGVPAQHVQQLQSQQQSQQMARNTIAGGNTPSQQQQPSSFPQTNVAAQAKPSKNTPVNTTPTQLPKTTPSLPPQDVKNQDISSNISQSKDQKPKRPMNAFIIFSSERRPELQKNDPNMQTAQVSKILGEEWQNMDSTRKDHYNERARQLKEEFKQSNPDFVYTRRGTAAATKKRGSTSSATPTVKSPDTIAVPPQATNVPIPNGSVNGVTSHNSNNVYTSPHQHTPAPSSTPTQQQRSTPVAATQQTQSTTTPQPQLRTPQTIGSTSTTPVSSARRDRKLRRPMNAFLIFNKEMRPKVLEMNPNMSVAEISKTIGENWRNMSEDERERYLQKARDLKSEFHESHPDFVYTRRSKAELIAAGHHSYSKKRSFPQNENSDTDEEPRSSHGNNPRDGSPATSPQKDPRGRKKKRSRHPTAPKHPMSGFLFYALEMRPHVAEQNPGSTVGPISKIIAGHWKNLTPEQRAPWEKKASDDKARYAREMEQYLQSQKDDE